MLSSDTTYHAFSFNVFYKETNTGFHSFWSMILSTDFRMPSNGQRAFPTSGSQELLKPFQNRLL